ncbi:hypothetical protein DCO48_04130 [Pseudomonas sp. SDI]|uniref:RHS repeat-associated core domain-containing protein n=1 Tax=Pseudomonas sp. SDI TaxID=2170734 RepID=UPI000DE6E8B0|nr:RHS repeat-associated core domain-containing protein [Pseudomonas sp. SDI]PWB35177.1 hypothetical protein DCO48_04130 [Pseudomonas sp. SDI]
MPESTCSTVCRYRYDAIDRLNELTANAQEPRQRFFRQSRLISEIQGRSSRMLFAHDQQLLAQTNSAASNRSVTLLANDMHASVLATQTTAGPHTLSYSPFGYYPFHDSSTLLAGFKGEALLSGSDSYLLGSYRAYSPVLKRLNSPDSHSPFGDGGLNAYAYCGAEPVNRTDPSGHSPLALLSKLVNKSVPVLHRAGAVRKPLVEAKHLGDNLFSYIDMYKNKPRLNVDAHGGKFVQGNGYIRFNNSVIEGDELGELLARQYDLEQFGSIRTLICFSADTGQDALGFPAFGKLLADSTGLPVKAFHGGVRTKDITPSNLTSITESMIYKIRTPSADYRPAYFIPATPRRSAIIRGTPDPSPAP